VRNFIRSERRYRVSRGCVQRFSVCLVAIGGVIDSGGAFADAGADAPKIVDVAQAIRYSLEKFGPVPWTHNYQAMCTTEIVDPARTEAYPCEKKATTMAVLIAGDIRISKSQPITFDKAQVAELPTLLHSAMSALQNCSTHTKNAHSEELEVAFSRVAKAAVTGTVVNAGSSRLNFSWAPSEQLSILGGVSITDAKTIVETDSDGSNMHITRRAKARISMPAQSAVALEVDTWPVTYGARFHTSITVDADLSPNDKKYHHLSDVLSEEQRTFELTGKISVVDAVGARPTSWDIPFNAQLCPASWPEGGEPVVVPFQIRPAKSTVVDTQWAIIKYARVPKKDESDSDDD
jgi:hypothetical protein